MTDIVSVVERIGYTGAIIVFALSCGFYLLPAFVKYIEASTDASTRVAAAIELAGERLGQWLIRRQLNDKETGQ